MIRLTAMAAAFGVLGLLAATCGGAEPSGSPAPPMAEISRVVREHFAAQPGYQPGDLITRRDALAVLKRLSAIGWHPGDASAIVERLLPDDHLLAQQFATEKGRAFMRQVSGLPNGMDRLERLSALPDGKRMIGQLAKGPDGYKLLEYLATSDGGQNMGRMLSQAPKGRNFNQPTQHIYTADELLHALHASYVRMKQ